MHTFKLDQFQPVPATQPREVLRDNPDLTYFKHLSYSDDKYNSAIRQEIQEKWIELNKGKDRDPVTNEGGYRKITKLVKAKYQELHRQHRARTLLWMQSERTLNLLRTKGQTPTPTQDQVDEAMLRFVQRLDLGRFPEIDESLPQLGPNQYFELSRPQLVADWGYPFYSTVVEQGGQPTGERIIDINSDFWGAFLGGDHRLGHGVVYFVPESRFYVFDLVLGCYVPTSEEKMRLWLSQSLQSRAWGQDATLASMILEKFRTKKVMDEILNKAKAVLAADAGYFQSDARPKWGGVPKPGEVQVIVDTFVKEHVEQADEGIMPLGECLLQLGKTSAVSLDRKQLTLKVNDAIRSTFNRGLRNDLRLPDDRVVAGWKGLRLRGHNALNTEIRDSVESEEVIMSL
jgi:hypothetical protein